MQKYTLAILIALSFAGIGAPAPAQAQVQKQAQVQTQAQTQAHAQTQAQARPTAAQLKPFEGYYRSSRMNDLVIHILIRNDTLVARPLWVDRDFHMLPKKELVFHTIEAVERAPVDIVFYRDSTGDIAALDLGNMNVKWNREKNYKPTVKKVMAHTPEQLKPFEGVYRLNREGERLIRFYVTDNNLILKQIWDGAEIPFHPQNDDDFFTDNIPSFSLQFTKDQQGNVTQVLAFGRDLWIKTPKPELTATDLQAASGKFQSKDDPDNQVAIEVKDKQLVLKQLWDNKEITLDALTADYFYNPSEQYKLQLHRDGNGKINEIVLLDTSTFERVGQ